MHDRLHHILAANYVQDRIREATGERAARDAQRESRRESRVAGRGRRWAARRLRAVGAAAKSLGAR